MKELDAGAVLVLEGPHKHKIGFYQLQSEQLYDMEQIYNCPDCDIKTEFIKNIQISNEPKQELHDPVPIETGTYCDKHQKALEDNDRAIVYWDKPDGDEYDLIRHDWLVNIPSTVYERYKRLYEKDASRALSELISELC